MLTKSTLSTAYPALPSVAKITLQAILIMEVGDLNGSLFTLLLMKLFVILVIIKNSYLTRLISMLIIWLTHTPQHSVIVVARTLLDLALLVPIKLATFSISKRANVTPYVVTLSL